MMYYVLLGLPCHLSFILNNSPIVGAMPTLYRGGNHPETLCPSRAAGLEGRLCLSSN